MEKEFLAPSDGKGVLRSCWWERSEETFKCHLRETKRSGDVFGKSRRSINIYNRPNVNEPIENIIDQKSWIYKWVILLSYQHWLFWSSLKKGFTLWAISDQFFFFQLIGTIEEKVLFWLKILETTQPEESVWLLQRGKNVFRFKYIPFILLPNRYTFITCPHQLMTMLMLIMNKITWVVAE